MNNGTNLQRIFPTCSRRRLLAASGVLVASKLAGLNGVSADDEPDSVETKTSETKSVNESPEPAYTDSKTLQWRLGLKLRTPVTFTNGLATFPIPMDWPEQSVTVTGREVSGSVTQMQVRDLPGGARQAVIGIARMTANTSLEVLLDYQIEKRDIIAPGLTETLVVPPRILRELRVYMGSSPMIDTTHRQIRALSRELAVASEADTSAWQTVRRIFDRVRQEVTYTEGPIRNASDALNDGKGDCEDMTSLFVALCRNAEIPARMVWIPGHCYPEFYLEQRGGGSDSGHWYPCQAAGSDLFGEMQEDRPILQKGDRFKIPGHRKMVRYIVESFRCDRSGNGDPKIEFIREQVL